MDRFVKKWRDAPRIELACGDFGLRPWGICFPQSNGHHDGRATASIFPPMAWIFPPKNDSIFSNMSVQYLHAPSPECAIVCSKFINSPHTIPPVSPICRAWVRSPHPLAQRADMIPNPEAKLRHELLTDINNRDKCGFSRRRRRICGRFRLSSPPACDSTLAHYRFPDHEGDNRNRPRIDTWRSVSTSTACTVF